MSADTRTNQELLGAARNGNEEALAVRVECHPSVEKNVSPQHAPAA
jgi:hypothetical protein